MIQGLAFYLFAGVAVASAFMVISARHPVHSVLYLILCFFNAAALFVLMGAEFLAMILVVVYVVAVAVLFLFVVIMIDINFREMRKGFLQYLPIGGVVALIFLAELVLVFGAWAISDVALEAGTAPTPAFSDVSNIEALGRLLYTEYVMLFQAAGMILLLAMVGAIVLTLRQREGVKRQKIARQNTIGREEAVSVVKVPTGSGV
ncbi:MAG: NADH-quinone oxidoreductase subunit J [Pseudomonadota bacterium]